MMNKYPFASMIYSILVLSVVLSLTSNNWLYIWMLLELNMLCFLPIMMSKFTAQQLEASVKYFLAQALGSTLLIMYSFSMWYMFPVSQVSTIMLTTGLMIKLGLAPFHFWYPSVMSSINWMTCLILSTMQKLIPLFLLIAHQTKMYLILTVAMLSALTGSIMGMNQSKLRSIMAYSSLSHLGWIFSMVHFNFFVPPIMYFIIYSTIITPIFMVFNKLNTLYISFMNKPSNQTMNYSLFIMFSLLTLGGIPPLTGFFPKWMTMSLLFDKTWVIITLIMSSIMSIYFYLSLIFASSLNQNMTTPKLSMSPYTISKLAIMTTLTMFLLPIMLMYAMTMFY